MAIKIGNKTVDLEAGTKADGATFDTAVLPGTVNSRRTTLNSISFVKTGDDKYTGSTARKVYQFETTPGTSGGSLTVRYSTNCNCKCKCICKCKCKCKCVCKCKCWSDEKLKTDIEGLGPNVLDKINQIQSVMFKYNDKGLNVTELMEGKIDEDIPLEQIGFLADEIEDIFPEMIEYVNIENEKYKAVSYIQMIPVLLESIKQLNKKVEDLQNNNDNSCEL